MNQFMINIGTTKVKMANSPEPDGKLPEFVERRRAALERYLNRTAIHPIFQVDPDFRDFLESGNLLKLSSNFWHFSKVGMRCRAMLRDHNEMILRIFSNKV